MISAAIPAHGRADMQVVPSAGPATLTPTFPAKTDRPDPSAQLDLTLGITVLSFHDLSGQVIATTPTQQQLNTYLLFGSSGHRSDGGHGLATLA